MDTITRRSQPIPISPGLGLEHASAQPSPSDDRQHPTSRPISGSRQLYPNQLQQHHKASRPLLDWFQKKIAAHKKDKPVPGGSGGGYVSGGSNVVAGQDIGVGSASSRRSGYETWHGNNKGSGSRGILNIDHSASLGRPTTGSPGLRSTAIRTPSGPVAQPASSPMTGWSTSSTSQYRPRPSTSTFNNRSKPKPKPIISTNRALSGNLGPKGISVLNRPGALGGEGGPIRRSTSRHSAHSSSRSARRSVAGVGSSTGVVGTGHRTSGYSGVVQPGPGVRRDGVVGSTSVLGGRTPITGSGRRAGSIKAPSIGSTSERRRRGNRAHGPGLVHHQPPFSHPHPHGHPTARPIIPAHSFRAPTFTTRSSASPVSSRANSLTGSNGYLSRSRSPSEHSLASSFLDPDEEDGRSWLPSVISRDVGRGGSRMSDLDGEDEEEEEDEGEGASLRPIPPSHRGSPAPSASHEPPVSLFPGAARGRSTESCEPLRFSASFFPPQHPGTASGPPSIVLRTSASFPRLRPISTPRTPSRTASILSDSTSAARYGTHGYASSDTQSKGWKSTSGRSGADSNGGVSTKPTTVASGTTPGLVWAPGLNGGMAGHIAIAPEQDVDVMNEDQAAQDSPGGGIHVAPASPVLPPAIEGYQTAVAGPGPSTQAAQSHLATMGLPVSSVAYRGLARNSLGSIHSPSSPLATSVVTPFDLMEGNVGEHPMTPLPNSGVPVLANVLPGSIVTGMTPPRYRLAQAPHRSDPHPRHNPKPLAPPSDNASLLTLASSEYANGGHTMWTRSIAGTLDGAWELDEEDRKTGSQRFNRRQSRASLGDPVSADEDVPPTPVPIHRSDSRGSPLRGGEEGDGASISFRFGQGGSTSMMGGVTASSYYFGGRRRSIVGEDASIRALRRRGSWESDTSRFSWVPGMQTSASTPGVASSSQAAPMNAGRPGIVDQTDMSVPHVSVTNDGPEGMTTLNTDSSTAAAQLAQPVQMTDNTHNT